MNIFTIAVATLAAISGFSRIEAAPRAITSPAAALRHRSTVTAVASSARLSKKIGGGSPSAHRRSSTEVVSVAEIGRRVILELLLVNQVAGLLDISTVAAVSTSNKSSAAAAIAAAAAAANGTEADDNDGDDDVLGQTWMKRNSSATGLKAILNKVSRPVKADDIKAHFGARRGHDHGQASELEDIRLLVAADRVSNEKVLKPTFTLWLFPLPTNLSSGSVAAAHLVVPLDAMSASKCVGWLSVTVFGLAPALSMPRLLTSLLSREANSSSDDGRIRVDITRLVKQWAAEPETNHGFNVQVESLVFHADGSSLVKGHKSCEINLPGVAGKQVATAVLDLRLRDAMANRSRPLHCQWMPQPTAASTTASGCVPQAATAVPMQLKPKAHHRLTQRTTAVSADMSVASPE